MKNKIIFNSIVLLIITCSKFSAQVVINEVMPKPNVALTGCDQTMVDVNNSTCGKEYIELFNKSSCDTIDISGYVVASKTSTSIGGAFTFPAGTKIAPLAHLVVGGPNASATAGSVDFPLTSFIGTAQLCVESNRWFLENTAGWVAIYTAAGIPLDAIYWTFSANQGSTLSSDVAYSYSPCIPTASGSITNLPSAKQMTLGTQISYVQDIPSTGFTFSRMPDGGSWDRNIAPTIAGTNNCNGGTCITGSAVQIQATATNPSCGLTNGSIIITNSGSYNYTWIPNVSTSSSALNLAAGTYTISIASLAGGCQDDTVITLSPSVALAGNVTNLQPNTICNASSGCNYTGPSILINEVNLYPNNNDGSIYGESGTTGNKEGEWIELYNPNQCDSVDISGFILGSYNSVGNALTVPAANGMGFVLPNGIKVPPFGFVVVRGRSAPVPPATAIDIVVDNIGGRLCIDGGIANSRIWFQNTGGWFGFYNASGVPQDMIKWGSPTPSDLNGNPCIPSTNSLPIGFTVLPSANASGITTNLGPTPNVGKTYVRIPDGGSWSNVDQGENTSYGTCNDLINGCVVNTGGSSTCNGSATVNITAGTAPYVYHWNDPLTQTAVTANKLCAGNYIAQVTDANSCQLNLNVTIVDQFYSITTNAINSTCDSTNGSINVVTSSSGIYDYVWSVNTGINDSISTTATNLGAGTYSVSVLANGCKIDTTIALTTTPSISDIIYTTTDISCGAPNGGVQISNITGGTSPYLYSINGSSYSGSTQFENLTSGSQALSVKDINNCYFSKPFTINGAASKDSVFVPNIFSPNNDSKNDFWSVKGDCIKSFNCQIFNRWGSKIYEYTDYINGKWDGTIKNQKASAGVYFYLIDIEYFDGVKNPLKGSIFLTE